MSVITVLTITVGVNDGLWSSPDLLRRLKQHARRPATDTSVTDDMWFDWMTEAQGPVFNDLFSRFPAVQWSQATLLTTTDGGYTYQFPTDAGGDPSYPMGFAEVFPTLASIPDSPLVYGEDYEVEGYLLRIPGRRRRTFTAGPYARYVSRPDVAITATVNPLLFPKESRMLLVWKALESWAARPGSGADPTYYTQQYAAALHSELLKFATAWNRGSGTGASRWYSNGDLYIRGLNV